MSTQGEDQRHVSDAATPITIPSGTDSVDLAALFALIPGANVAPYARVIVNPSATITLTVTALRFYDSKIQPPGINTGATMALQPGEKWFGHFTKLLASSSSGQIVNIER